MKKMSYRQKVKSLWHLSNLHNEILRYTREINLPIIITFEFNTCCWALGEFRKLSREDRKKGLVGFRQLIERAGPQYWGFVAWILRRSGYLRAGLRRLERIGAFV